MQQKISQGETVYLLGLGVGSHSSGVALVEVSVKEGVRLIRNNKEERYTGIKHYMGYPEKSIEALVVLMKEMGIGPEDIHAGLSRFDVPEYYVATFRNFLEELPYSLALLKKNASIENDAGDLMRIIQGTSRRLGEQLGLKRPFPIIGVRHHDAHAYFSYAVSPFTSSEEPVMISVIDGNGDDGAISLYLAQGNEVKLLYENQNLNDSLGTLYRFLSATQGGWTPYSSEGRYMGAAAWGDQDRMTNTYYPQLRELISLNGNGEVLINRSLANWTRQRWIKPYSRELEKILGPPIPAQKLWNPDAVLKIDMTQNEEIDQDRVDKAAAVQMVFEDALFHIIEHLIQTTGSDKLVLTGGTALNCVANSRLLERFDENYYESHFGMQETRLQVWAPPTPGDVGATMGATYAFAMANGVPLGEPLKHAFYCGMAPTTDEIKQALEASSDIAFKYLGNLTERDCRDQVADLLAYIVSQDGMVGVYQGVAETGPRALGHRSILANPCNPETLSFLNKYVKFREVFRPLAPMATYEAAQRWFALSPGASADEHNAYNYMVLTAPARPESREVIPAVIHKDGSSRIQIVREESDPFTFAYLKAMGRRVGVEVSVNTSLNVGSPIVQTPPQALEVLRRAKGLGGILLIGDDGEAFLAWYDVMDPPADAGQRLMGWVKEWEAER